MPEVADNGVAAQNGEKPWRIEPDLEFKKELEEFGATTFTKCYQCATCSAICALSSEDKPFPRKEVAWALWGQKDRIIRDPDIWACHYCGECSTNCPRGAYPGELMMALRRYATSCYDWTGISRRLYKSAFWEIGAVLTVSLIVVGLFALSGAFASERMPTDHVSVHTFIPVHLVHYGDVVMAAILTFFLMTNSLRMALFIIDGQKIPISVFITEFKTLVLNAAFQNNWRTVEGKKTRWIKHFILVTGYGSMFMLVMVFLKYLQEDSSDFNWVSIIGYYSTFAILYFSGDAMIGRLRKNEEVRRFSHESDWMFLILLFLTGLTGIMMHASRMMDFALPTYYMYVIHLSIAVPMLVVEVPFMKWSHLMYRPLAIYLKAVKKKAAELDANA